MRRQLMMAIAVLSLAAPGALAQEVLKIGVSLPMTGVGFNAVGRQISAAIRLYMQQHGDQVAGKKIEVIIRDDAGVADMARRLVQEMIVNDKVAIVGADITPAALAIAPLVTQARIATVVL